MLLPSVAYFMVVLDALVVATALPSIHRSLGGGIGTLQWTVSAYAITYGAGILTAVALGDRLGRRRVYLAGLALFTAASAACALAPTAGILIACRAVQGTGAAIVMPLGLTLLTSAFPADRRGTVVGIWGAIAGLAVASGPLIGGAITQGLSWHWIFWVNVPIGVAAMIGTRLRLQESRGPRARLDVPALALVSGGAGVLIWGLVQGGQAGGWGSRQNVAGLALGTLLLLGFVVREAYAREPMIPLGLFRRTSFSAAVGTQFLLAAAIFSAVFLTSQFFQFGLGNSPLEPACDSCRGPPRRFSSRPSRARLSDRVGARALIVPGLAMQAAGFAWIVALASTSASYGRYVLPFIIAGVGISMAIPCVTVAGLNAAPPALLGKAAGTLNTMQQFGAVFGIAIVTAVFNSKGSLASPAAVTSGYRPALAVAAGLSVLGAVVAIGIRKTTRTPAPGVASHQIRPSSPDLARQKYEVVLPMESEVGRS